MENKYNRTIRKEDLDNGTENAITGTKYVSKKYGNKLVIIISYKDERFDLFSPKCFIPRQLTSKRNLEKN